MQQRVEVIQSEGLTVSLLCWRLWKRKPELYVERVLALNPGISELPFLPVGMTVILPLDDVPTGRKRTVIRLWD